jgi:protein TonB
MMIQTAGGPGLVSPIDYGERKKPMPAWMWGAIGISALLHVAAGAWLYQQRYEMPTPIATDEEPGIRIEMFTPVIPPVTLSKTPPAPNPPIHRPVLIPTNTDTLPAVVPDNPVSGDSTVITITKPVADPIPGGTGSTPAAEPRPGVITHPSWLRKASGDQLMRAYPDRALRNQVTGSATLRCLVRIDGGLSGCSVLSETPGGQGFGRAAMSLSRYFRMNPGAVDGQAIDGAQVNVGVRFTLPED